jgi:predicted amidophosphoribosyltransferase
MVEYYPTSVRLPVDVRNRIKSIAKTRNTTPSQIIIEACIEYLDKSTPGLCPSCHTQNNPDSQYCQKCGSSLLSGTSDPFKKYKDERDELISEVDRVLEILEPYKPLIELTREFSKEDILLLVRLSGALMKNKDLMREMVEKVHEKEDNSSE